MGRRQRKRWMKRFGAVVGPWVIFVLVRSIGVTWRIRVRGHRHLRTALAHGPVIIAGLHGRMFHSFHALSRPPYLPWRILVSQSSDGDFMAGAARCLGADVARGSSGRGGERGYLQLVRSIRDRPDAPVVFFVDGGGRGPRGHVKPGAIRLAESTRGSIVPIVASSRPCWVARSWDRCQIAPPFARIEIRLLPPQQVGQPTGQHASSGAQTTPVAADAAREGARHRLEQVLVGAQTRLDQVVGHVDDEPVRLGL